MIKRDEGKYLLLATICHHLVFLQFYGAQMGVPKERNDASVRKNKV